MSNTPRTDAYSKSQPTPERWEWIEKCEQLERELTASNERIRLLISERDTARGYADQKWKLRQEFHDLFGTDDVAEAVALVCGLKDRIKRLEKSGDDLESWLDRNTPFTIRNSWRKAKESKP